MPFICIQCLNIQCLNFNVALTQVFCEARYTLSIRTGRTYGLYSYSVQSPDSSRCLFGKYYVLHNIRWWLGVVVNALVVINEVLYARPG